MAEVIQGGEKLTRALDAIIHSGLQTRPAMELIADNWRNLVKSGFLTSQDPYGRKWDGILRSGQPLKNTSRLLNSIEHESSDDQAITGTNVCYAIVHQTGATITAGKSPHMSLCGSMTKGANVLRFKINGQWVSKKQVKIPARPIFPSKALGGLPANWEREATNILIDHLRSGIKP